MKIFEQLCQETVVTNLCSCLVLAGQIVKFQTFLRTVSDVGYYAINPILLCRSHRDGHFGGSPVQIGARTGRAGRKLWIF